MNCRFLPRLAHIACPLTDSLCKAKNDFTNTPEMITSVNQVKDAISQATLLVHPRCDVTLSITTDASDYAKAGSSINTIEGGLSRSPSSAVDF